MFKDDNTVVHFKKPLSKILIKEGDYECSPVLCS